MRLLRRWRRSYRYLRSLCVVAMCPSKIEDASGSKVRVQKRNLIRALCRPADVQGRWATWFFHQKISPALDVHALIIGALLFFGTVGLAIGTLIGRQFRMGVFVALGFMVFLNIWFWKWHFGQEARMAAQAAIKRNFVNQGLCPACGYSLSASNSDHGGLRRCTECGGQWRILE